MPLSMNASTFKGRIVFITGMISRCVGHAALRLPFVEGASRGIGREIALR